MKIILIILIVLIVIVLIGFMTIKMIGKKPVEQFLKNEIPAEKFKQELTDEFAGRVDNSEELHIVRYIDKELQLNEEYAYRTALLVSYSPLIVRDIVIPIGDRVACLYDLGSLITSEDKFDEVLASGKYLQEEKEIEISQLVSPIEYPCQIFGIGYNYSEHSAEVGESKAFKGKDLVVFEKGGFSFDSLSNDIVKPAEVELMDYEVELGIVVGKKIDANTILTLENYQEHIAGYVLVNDLSARDVQLKLGKLWNKTAGFSKAKSYPGFCPIGPVFLYTKKKQDFWLRQYLQRDGNYYLLQEGNSKDMINSCYDILKELQARKTILKPGNLIATGTPAGVAFNFDVSYVVGCGGKQEFIDFEKANNEKYLRKGDVLIAVSKKLGFQKFKIK